MSPAHRGSLFSFAVRAVSGTAANLHLKQFHRDIVLTGYQDPVVLSYRVSCIRIKEGCWDSRYLVAVKLPVVV